MPGQRQDSDNAEKNKAYEDERKRRQFTQGKLEDIWRESPNDDEHETKINSVWFETAHSLVLIFTTPRRLWRSASIGDRSVRKASDSMLDSSSMNRFGWLAKTSLRLRKSQHDAAETQHSRRRLNVPFKARRGGYRFAGIARGGAWSCQRAKHKRDIFT